MYWNSNSSFVDKWAKVEMKGCVSILGTPPPSCESREIHLHLLQQSKGKKTNHICGRPPRLPKMQGRPICTDQPAQRPATVVLGLRSPRTFGAVGSDGSACVRQVYCILKPTARQGKRRVETNSKNQRRPISPPCSTGELTMACTVMLKLPLMYPVSSFMSFSRGISLVIS